MALLFVDSLPKNKSKVLRNSIKVLELLLISAGMISTIVMVKGAVNMPYSCDIVFSSLVGFWTSIRCVLSSPLYICIIINSIVLLIAASSALHRHENEHNNHDDEVQVSFEHDILQNHDETTPSPPPPRRLQVRNIVTKKAVPPPPTTSPPRDITEVESPLPSITTSTTSTLYRGSIHKDLPNIQPPIFSSETTTSLYPNISQEDYGEDALLSSFLNEARMSQHHEIKKTTPKTTKEEKVTTNPTSSTPTKRMETFVGNLSYENENEEEDTMEATWKAITGGGKQKPKKKHLKKSETWDVPPLTTTTTTKLPQPSISASWKELRKSETFNDAVSITRRGGLRRDPSMSIDDFNKQVEAFIKNFNDDMRLQRQESDQRFMDMVNRGL